MHRRADTAAATHRRITEAAMRLHTTLGPSAASLSAVAAEAGVTRLTLYRHFADADALFAACMGHWRTLHPPPDVAAWGQIRGLERRLRHGLRELYDWYRDNAADLYPIYRDAAFTPASNQAARRATNERMVGALLGDDSRGASAPRHQATAGTLHAAMAHVVGFWTWRSLAIEGNLTQAQAVDLATRFVLAARRTSSADHG
jgi:AcrR family transcriptional regulator